MEPLFPWPDDDPEVQEVCEEYRRAGIPLSYSNGQFRGWRDRLGRPNPRMRVPDAELARIAQRVMELKMESAEEETETQQAQGQAQAARRRRRLGQWGMGVATAFGGHVATMVVAGALAAMPVMAELAQAALAPLGQTGAASAQVGMAFVQFLSNSIRAVSRIGGMIVGAALYTVLGPAFGIAFGFITAELGSLLGSFGQALGQALRGVREVFADLNRIGRETADVIARIATNAGMAAEQATRLTIALQAAGVPLQTVQQIFGQWGARREFLEPRLAVLGIGYEEFLQRPMLTLHDAAMQLPELIRLPMLRAVLGPAADQLYPLIMRPRAELEEAQRLAERWLPSPDAMMRVQQRFEAMQSRVELLGRAIRLHLLEGFLPLMEAGLQALIRLWDENREAIVRFATETAPRAVLDALQRAVDWLRTHWDDLVAAAQRFADALRRAVEWLREAARLVRDIARWIQRHPALTMAIVGGISRGLPGAIGGFIGAEIGAGLGHPWLGGAGGIFAATLAAQAIPWLWRAVSRAGGVLAEGAVPEWLAGLSLGAGRVLAPIGAGLLAFHAGRVAMGAAEAGHPGVAVLSILGAMGTGAAAGFAVGGPAGALVGAGLGGIVAGVGALTGRRGEAAAEAEAESDAWLQFWESLTPEQRRAFAALPAARQAMVRRFAEAGAYQRALAALEGPQDDRARNVLDRLAEALQSAREAWERQRREGVRLRAELEVELKPRVTPDFLLQLEAAITRRQVMAIWRDLQREMA